MQLGLTGKRAVVLASSSGLGYACAHGLAAEGCAVVVCSRSKQRVTAAAERIREETGARVEPVVADVSVEADVRDVVATCVDTFGGLEIAVHNAGGPPAGGFTTTEDDSWYHAFDQNLMSFVWLARASVPAMKRVGYGRILAITSSSIKQPIPNLVLSNTMRTGVLGAAKTLSREVAADNILVNVVAPGRIATERVDALDRANAEKSGKTFDEIREASLASIPVGRLGTPEEFANMIVFLASEAASYITGAAIQVDGGRVSALQ